ncbi:MAG: hypothetical protein EB168_10945 [Euryarchaeota archaeon]|nr:hypothetical protein [Euryarchaeota archaeon]
MKNLIYLLVIGLLAMSGCYDLNTESATAEKEVASQQQVRVSLGDRFSSRNQRYKGNYQDVVNGGSVSLFYSFEGGQEESKEMILTGSQWTINLTLSVGVYTFRAEAYNGAGDLIFETNINNPKSYTIDPQTTNLNLGLQLNPVLLDEVQNTPMPVISGIMKPAGYWPGNNLDIIFVVAGGLNDELRLNLCAIDSQGNENCSGVHYASEYDIIESTESHKVYEGQIGVSLPDNVSGSLAIDLSVFSPTLQSSKHAQFTLDGPVNVTGDNGTLVFTPQATINWMSREEDDNQTVSYVMNLSGNTGFTDDGSGQANNHVYLSQRPANQAL